MDNNGIVYDVLYTPNYNNLFIKAVSIYIYES